MVIAPESTRIAAQDIVISAQPLYVSSWQAAAEAIREGLAWCDHQLNSAGEFRYRLRGFDLERL